MTKRGQYKFGSASYSNKTYAKDNLDWAARGVKRIYRRTLSRQTVTSVDNEYEVGSRFDYRKSAMLSVTLKPISLTAPISR